MESLVGNKTCESCGESFGCGAKLYGCWCAEVEVPLAVAHQLKAKYTDCLCPACLAALAAIPGIRVTFTNGETELIAGAVRVDTENFHEGMFDFYDNRGVLLRQISMSSDIKWESTIADLAA